MERTTLKTAQFFMGKIISSVSIKTTKFVFADFNRAVLNRKDLKVSIREARRVKEQIEVIEITEVPDGYCKFIDPKTGNEVKNIEEGTLLVLDGQHRLSCVYAINQEEEQMFDKIQKERELAMKKDKVVPELYEPIQIEHIDILVKTLEDIGDIRTYVIEKNNLCKKWSGDDFVDSLSKESYDNDAIKAANKLKSLKCSASTIGLYLDFDKKTLSPSAITEHFKKGTDIDLPQWKRGIKLYMLFAYLGLPQVILKSRYVIEMFIKAQSKGDAAFNKLVEEFSQLSTISVQEVMKLTGEEAMNKLLKLMKEDYKQTKNNNDSMCTYYQDITDEQISSFINEIPVDDKKKKSNKKETNEQKADESNSEVQKQQPSEDGIDSTLSPSVIEEIMNQKPLNKEGQVEVVETATCEAS